tara:strand:- start:1291 stop:2016 length:726 start_codon:yes stop_codon:yes gene_type:complete
MHELLAFAIMASSQFCGIAPSSPMKIESAARLFVDSVVDEIVLQTTAEDSLIEPELADWIDVLASRNSGVRPDMVVWSLRTSEDLAKVVREDSPSGRLALKVVLDVVVGCHVRSLGRLAESHKTTPKDLPLPPMYPGRGGALVGPIPTPQTNFDDPDEVKAHRDWERAYNDAIAAQERHRELAQQVDTVEREMRVIVINAYAASERQSQNLILEELSRHSKETGFDYMERLELSRYLKHND